MDLIKAVDKLKAERYLEQIRKSDARIDSKLVELYQLRCLATKVTSQLGSEPVQTSGVSDKVGNIAAKIVDLEAEINRLIDKFIDDKQERIKVIEQVDDALLYTILHKHYVQYKKFVTIAEEEHYTEVHISNKHQEALEKVQEILDRKKGQGN
jgi:hypothetical protein